MAVKRRDADKYNIEWEDMDLRKFYTLGATIFVINRCILYPPSLIKTRMMCSADNTRTTLEVGKTIVKQEGPRALWKGFSAALFGIGASMAYLTMYAQALPTFIEHRGFTSRQHHTQFQRPFKRPISLHLPHKDAFISSVYRMIE